MTILKVYSGGWAVNLFQVIGDILALELYEIEAPFGLLCNRIISIYNWKSGERITVRTSPRKDRLNALV